MAKKKIDKKSPIRHILTAIGVLLSLLGLGEYVPIIEYLDMNFDGLWNAVLLLVGAVTTVWGYLFGREKDVPDPGGTGSAST